MKKYTLLLSFFLLIIFLSSFSVSHTTKTVSVINTIDGKTIFAANGCTICHTNSESSIGPKISVIATAYKGKKEQLIKFLNREAKPIVVPEDFAIMAANLFATKKMSDAEKTALAEYILSAK